MQRSQYFPIFHPLALRASALKSKLWAFHTSYSYGSTLELDQCFGELSNMAPPEKRNVSAAEFFTDDKWIWILYNKKRLWGSQIPSVTFNYVWLFLTSYFVRNLQMFAYSLKCTHKTSVYFKLLTNKQWPCMVMLKKQYWNTYISQG